MQTMQTQSVEQALAALRHWLTEESERYDPERIHQERDRLLIGILRAVDPMLAEQVVEDEELGVYWYA